MQMEPPTGKIGSLADIDQRISYLDSSTTDANEQFKDGLSLYEWTFKLCTASICRSPGDKFNQLQKMLLKHIFSDSNIRSLFASDLYAFLFRLMLPDYRKSMCQIVMNLCRIAPPGPMVKGAALINRLQHPEVNFSNSMYKDILAFD